MAAFFCGKEQHMATTRIIKHYAGKGQTIAGSLAARFDYGLDIKKTGSDGPVRAYGCDHETAEAEFTLAKAQYLATTGRKQKIGSDVLCYQIRQSFKPGEVTPELANEIGYDFAMRWTKGRFAFFVATHTDRKHIHNHIYYNSTSLDCKRKFRDFLGSARAVRRLSDRICFENNLSVVHKPRLKSRGIFKHYGEWLGGNKEPTFKELLKMAVDKVMSQNPGDFESFLLMMADEGFEHKLGRGGVLSFRTTGQERYTRLRPSTLGSGYGLEEIRAAISGGPPIPKIKENNKPVRVNLIIDIQKKMREGKGAAYRKWATVHNLKQMAAALQYLQENDLLRYEDLEAKTETAMARFNTAGEKLKQTEASIKRNVRLKKATVDYAKTRPVFQEYKKQKYSRKFLVEHEADIAIYRSAQAEMKELLQGAKLPKMDELKTEWQTLQTTNKSQYAEYKAAQKDMRGVITVKANIDHLLGIDGKDKHKEMEK